MALFCKEKCIMDLIRGCKICPLLMIYMLNTKCTKKKYFDKHGVGIVLMLGIAMYCKQKYTLQMITSSQASKLR